MLSGCSAMFHNSGQKQTQSSSLVDFLYPNNKNSQRHRVGAAVVDLPVRIGLAFVPSKTRYRQTISQAEKTQLLQKVRKAFEHYPFISDIKVIPDAYLHSGGGFDTIDQVSRLYDLDLMALVSYDQLSTTRDNNAALLYLSIVGLYVIPGNSNSVQTFVDTAVFDIKSRQLLLRAPGVSKLENISTAVGIQKNRSKLSIQGFNLAVNDMNKNLDLELQQLKNRVKTGKSATKVNYRDGYTATGGGGSLSIYWIFALGILVAFRRQQDKVSYPVY